MTTPAEAEPKIRVLHTTRSLRIDGVGKVLLRNIAHRNCVRFVHHVCSLRNEVDLAEECRQHGVEPVFLGYTGPASLARTFVRAMRLIRSQRIDVVHANRTLDLLIAGTAAKLCGVPVVSSIHWLGRLEDHPETADEAPWLRRWVEMRTTVMLNRLLAARVVAVSDAVKASYTSMRGFPVDRIRVVYPGIDMLHDVNQGAEARASLRRQLGVDGARPLLLNVGRLDIVKGQRHLIPMMRRILECEPAAKLLIAGEGGLRSTIAEAIASAGLAESILLLGARSDIDALLDACDVLVLSSESEAAPLPLFEAMRAGKPVVATCVGGVREIVRHGDTGLIVPRGDPQAMARAVLQISQSPGEAQRMGEAARQRALSEFDLRRSVQALEDIYSHLTESA